MVATHVNDTGPVMFHDQWCSYLVPTVCIKLPQVKLEVSLRNMKGNIIEKLVHMG